MKSIFAGINVGHDQAVAAVDAMGELIYFAEEERFNRIRFSMSKPTTVAWRKMFEQTRREPNDVVGAAVPFMPDKFDALIDRLMRQSFPAGTIAPQSIRSTLSWYRIFSSQCRAVAHQFDLPAGKAAYLDHHDCHAASAFYPSGFDQAAVLVIDGSGEDVSASIFRGDGDGLRRLQQIDLPDSLGLLWAHVTAWLGFGGLGHEGKTMGLAPYGTPKLIDLFREQLIDWNDNGIYRNKTDVFLGDGDIETVLGPRRNGADALTPESADVAATLQCLTEEIVLRLARYAQELTGASALCYAGGVALNSVANGRIMSAGVFKDYFFQPAANDAGAALGAAILLQRAHAQHPHPPRWTQKHLYFGTSVDDTDIGATLARYALPARRHHDPARWAAARIAEGKVVGWARGRFEYGPRALGNRSILADPRDPGMKDVVNRRVKYREAWRPFAPSVLSSRVGDYFDIDYPSPYMIQVYKARDEWAGRMSAVCHVDGTCRVQTVDRDINPDFHRLIEHFEQITGIGCVLNTSFNVKGEPIVTTDVHAIEDFLRTDMDALVVGDFVLEKSDVGDDARQSVETFQPHRENVPRALREMVLSDEVTISMNASDDSAVCHVLATIVEELSSRRTRPTLLTDSELSDDSTARSICRRNHLPLGSIARGFDTQSQVVLVLVRSMFAQDAGIRSLLDWFEERSVPADRIWVMDRAGVAVTVARGNAIWRDEFVSSTAVRNGSPTTTVAPSSQPSRDVMVAVSSGL
jgi:carbamoyltransferase